MSPFFLTRVPKRASFSKTKIAGWVWSCYCLCKSRLCPSFKISRLIARPLMSSTKRSLVSRRIGVKSFFCSRNNLYLAGSSLWRVLLGCRPRKSDQGGTSNILELTANSINTIRFYSFHRVAWKKILNVRGPSHLPLVLTCPTEVNFTSFIL